MEKPVPYDIPESLYKYGAALLPRGISPLYLVQFFSKAFSISARYSLFITFHYDESLE